MNKCNEHCTDVKDENKKGLLSGIFYGIIPHSVCLSFIIFSMLGTVVATSFIKKILLIENIFSYLIVISIILATTTIYFYLKRNNCLCSSGIKNKWKYITVVYLATIITNMIFFYGVIPVLANINSNNTNGEMQNTLGLTIKVNIPCTGHSFLIIDEVKKTNGIASVQFESPDIFKIKYDPIVIQSKDIVSLKIFQEFKATVQ